jgi:prefoldin beta subunit
MMRNEETSELNKNLLSYENLEKQLEVLLIQKHQLQLQFNEIKHALEELKKTKGAVYRSIGSIMVSSSREEAEKDLNERVELVQVKLNAVSKQEERLRGNVAEAQKKLQEKMKQYEKSAKT